MQSARCKIAKWVWGYRVGALVLVSLGLVIPQLAIVIRHCQKKFK